MSKARKAKLAKLGLVLLFVIGLGITLYPAISNFYYRIETTEEIKGFEREVAEMEPADLQERMDLARAYNATLEPSKLSDPYTEEEKKGIAEYARMLEVREKMGHVYIPSIEQDVVFYAGTSDAVLQKGAGHLEGTSLPVGGESTHSVITAHRGLPDKLLFRHLDRLEEGDIFYVYNIETVLAYEIDQILIVDPSDFGPVLIVEGEDLCTLLTCTPYMINSHRLLVRGHRIPYTPPVREAPLQALEANMQLRLMFFAALAVLLLLLIFYFRNSKQVKRAEERVRKIEKQREEA